MLVSRWQAPILPKKEQIIMMFEAEGLQTYEERLPPQSSIQNHRHPFDEVRMVFSGELMVDVSGNKLLLRPGDKIIIPSNTKHSKSVGETQSVFAFAPTNSINPH